MQEARSNQQSVIKEKIYYVSEDYIIQDSAIFNSPVLISRNGGGSPEKIRKALNMCNMEIKERKDNLYILGVKTDA